MGLLFNGSAPGSMAGLLNSPKTAGLLGMAEGLLAASGAHRLPVTMGQGLAMGLQGAQQFRHAAEANKLLGAQARTAQLQNEWQSSYIPAEIRALNHMFSGGNGNPAPSPTQATAVGNAFGMGGAPTNASAGQIGNAFGLGFEAPKHTAAPAAPRSGIDVGGLFPFAMLEAMGGKAGLLGDVLRYDPAVQEQLDQARAVAENKVRTDQWLADHAKTPGQRRLYEIAAKKDSGELQHTWGGVVDIGNGQTWTLPKQPTPMTHAELFTKATQAYHELYPYGGGKNTPTFDQFMAQHYPSLGPQSPRLSDVATKDLPTKPGGSRPGVTFGGSFPYVHFGNYGTTPSTGTTSSASPQRAAYVSPDAVRAAYQSGKLSKAQATKILQSRFGYK